jgi:hypothetical protein
MTATLYNMERSASDITHVQIYKHKKNSSRHRIPGYHEFTPCSKYIAITGLCIEDL